MKTRYAKTMRDAIAEVWANDITLDEGRMKTIATMFDAGKTPEQIAKKMKLPVATVKSILGEEDLPTSERSVFFNNKSYTDKVYNKAIDDMIKDKDR